MTFADTLFKLVRTAYDSYRRPTTEELKAVSRDLVKDPSTPATALFLAVRHILGPGFVEYEPETIWLSLDMPELNRGKLMAAIALDIHPRFYKDYRVLGATTKAFNGELVYPETIPHCTAAELAWAVYEAELIFAITDPGSTEPIFYEDDQAYAAASLYNEGLVLVPKGLEFCEELLTDLLLPEARTLRTEAKKAWEDLPKEDLSEHDFGETPVGTQLFRAAAIQLYQLDRAETLLTTLQKLT